MKDSDFQIESLKITQGTQSVIFFESVSDMNCAETGSI